MPPQKKKTGKKKSPTEMLRRKIGKMIRDNADKYGDEISSYFDKMLVPMTKKDKKQLIVGSYEFTPYAKFKSDIDAKNLVANAEYFGADKIYRKGRIVYYENY